MKIRLVVSFLVFFVSIGLFFITPDENYISYRFRVGHLAMLGQLESSESINKRIVELADVEREIDVSDFRMIAPYKLEYVVTFKGKSEALKQKSSLIIDQLLNVHQEQLKELGDKLKGGLNLESKASSRVDDRIIEFAKIESFKSFESYLSKYSSSLSCDAGLFLAYSKSNWFLNQMDPTISPMMLSPTKIINRDKEPRSAKLSFTTHLIMSFLLSFLILLFELRRSPH